MFDDFYEILLDLNRSARDLLEDAERIDTAIKSDQGIERIKDLRSAMGRLCKGMDAIVEQLEPRKSVLDRFKRRSAGVAYAPTDPKKNIEEFLDAHAAQLRAMGVSEAMIKRLTDAIAEVRGSADEAIQVDIDAIARNLRNIRELICRSSKMFDKAAESVDVLRGCVQGAMGAATIVIDITGAFTVPDVTGLVIFKAVKSTVIGGRMVHQAIRSIRNGFKKLGMTAPRLEEPADPREQEQPSDDAPAPDNPPNNPARRLPNPGDRYKLDKKPK